VAIYHRATLVPTKQEAVAAWIPTQPWGPSADATIDVIGAYRFDDPDGRVGMEVHLATDGATVYHVPLTYRDAPVAGADDALVTEMEHSVLGTRWVYDGLADSLLLTMLAAVTMTGQGEALGMVVLDGRMHIAPTNVRIEGGGWSLERVAVDAFTSNAPSAESPLFTNDRFALSVHRRPVAQPRPPIALTASWGGQPPVLLASINER
jgi:hypothetical protein